MPRLIAALAAILFSAGALADVPKLANPRDVFPEGVPAYKSESTNYVFSMRLAPSGKRILYSRPVKNAEVGDRTPGRYELVLRELAGGKETVLPVGPILGGRRYQPIRFDPFDSTGARILLPSVTYEARKRAGRTETVISSAKWLIYDVAAAKVRSTSLSEKNLRPTKFAPGGNALLFTTTGESNRFATKVLSLEDPNAEPKPLSVEGRLQSVCPAGNVAVIHVPRPLPSSTRAEMNEQDSRRPDRLVLYDLKANKELVRLPSHSSRNSSLGFRETQWTADGRYLYYRDVEEVPYFRQPELGQQMTQVVTRVWDRQAGKLVGQIYHAEPVGPGPGPSLMVLSKWMWPDNGGFLLHDLATGSEFPLGGNGEYLIHAHAGKVLYAQKSGDSGFEKILVADLVMPKPEDSASPAGAPNPAR